MKKQKYLLFIIVLVFIFIPFVHAADKVVVIPLGGKQASLKGDLYQTIPFSAFIPFSDDVNYKHTWFFATVGTLEVEPGPFAGFNAPVILPDNAIITEIALSASDVSDGGTIFVWLQKFSFETTGVEFIPTNNNERVSSEDFPTDEHGVSTVEIDNEVIDNQKYYYSLYALFNPIPADTLRAVRIKYRLP